MNAPSAEPAHGPNRKWRILLFVLMTIAVGWLDLFFFDRAESLQFGWFVLSGVALVAGYHFLFRRRK
jgi:hypothetical protein